MSRKANLTDTEQVEQNNANALNHECTLQQHFHDLRDKIFTELVVNDAGKNSVNHLLEEAHKAACASFLLRCEEASQLLAYHGKDMRMPKLYDILAGKKS